MVYVVPMLFQELDCALAYKEKEELLESKKTPDDPQEMDIRSMTSSFKEEMVTLVTSFNLVLISS